MSSSSVPTNTRLPLVLGPSSIDLDDFTPIVADSAHDRSAFVRAVAPERGESLGRYVVLGKLGEMVQPGDAFDLVGKSLTFAVVSALVACHEGLCGPGTDRRAVADATFRAICTGLLVMLVINACWFTVEYLSGPAFGPSLALR